MSARQVTGSRPVIRRGRRGGLLDSRADAVAIAVRPGAPVHLGAGAADIAQALEADLGAYLAAEKATGKVGEVHSVAALARLGSTRTVWFVGVGAASPHDLREAGAVLARRARDAVTLATTLAAGLGNDAAQALAEGIGLASYSYPDYKSDPKPSSLKRVDLYGTRTSVDAALERAAIRTRATWLARDLANTPSLEKSPTWLAARATAAARHAGLKIRVRDERELAAEGFGGLLAVGMGSTRGPRLIEISYSPPGATRHVVLIGKGITFDSGGLSIKPNDGMVAMKTDMAGGASVIAAMTALPALADMASRRAGDATSRRAPGWRSRVTALIPAAENMPSGTAQRPGDVIRHYGGRTVEVLNTDAEGRLVLADALGYADATLAPDYVVDVATLTGAIGVALGRKTGGLFANDERLASALLDASARSGEPLWRMPLVEDYRRALDSDIADLKNTGDEVKGGAITAALFLREFAGHRRWAHLDIAGAARSDSDDAENTKGATGFGVRTLLSWLERLR